MPIERPLTRTVPISVAVHAALFALLFTMARERASDSESRGEALEMMTADLESAADEATEEPGATTGRVGAGDAASRAAAVVKSGERRRRAERVNAGRKSMPSVDDGDSTLTAAADSAETNDEVAPGSVVGDLSLTGGLGVGDRGGFGNGGSGDGNGRGVLPRVDHLPTPSLPPAPSKARPARLIYPSRNRQIRDDRLFVVIVNVDERGYVTGVKLKRGLDAHSNQKALDAVWRFRYDPARDDDGSAIASRLEQKFMLGW